MSWSNNQLDQRMSEQIAYGSVSPTLNPVAFEFIICCWQYFVVTGFRCYILRKIKCGSITMPLDSIRGKFQITHLIGDYTLIRGYNRIDRNNAFGRVTQPNLRPLICIFSTMRWLHLQNSRWSLLFGGAFSFTLLSLHSGYYCQVTNNRFALFIHCIQNSGRIHFVMRI